MHPLDETLADPAAGTADHALAILRGLPKPLGGLELRQIVEWARAKRAERLRQK